MPFVNSSLLAMLDSARGIAGGMGLHVFTVTERRIVDTGERPGMGTQTRTDTVLLCTGQAPKVEQLNSNDVFRSGGRYQAGDYRVGPLTPSYPGGGIDDASTDPTPASGSLTVLYCIAGPGMPPAGLWCDLKGIDESSMHRYLVLRAASVQDP